MDTLQDREIGQFVAEDYRTAVIFNKYGIDFCCRGNRSLAEVCNKKGIALGDILNELSIAMKTNHSASIDYKSWPLDLLATYIEKIHHTYVEEKTPVLLQFLAKLEKVHGKAHPELIKINALFNSVAGELAQHMKKEELILFPFIKEMVQCQRSNKPLRRPPFGMVENPITMMEHEHEHAGTIFKEIALLTDNYMPPGNACTTYRVTYELLHAFEEDLHLHIHLENNILFPKSLRLEQQLRE